MENLEHQITTLGAPDHRALGHHKIVNPRDRMGVVLLFYPQGIPEVYGETTLFSAHFHVGCLGHCGFASSFRNAMFGNLENMLPFKTSDMSSIRGTTCPLVSRCGTFSCPQTLTKSSTQVTFFY